jgi:hypothetical protein
LLILLFLFGGPIQGSFSTILNPYSLDSVAWAESNSSSGSSEATAPWWKKLLNWIFSKLENHKSSNWNSNSNSNTNSGSSSGSGSPTPTPEPATIFLAATGVGLAALLRKRSRK